MNDPQTGKKNIPKKFSHCCKGSESHFRLPSLGIWQRDWESPGNLKLEGQWNLITRFPQDWGKQRLQSWRTQTKPSERQDSEERSNDPRRLNHNYLLVLEGLLWRCGSGGARHRARALAAAVWECPPWHKPSWRQQLTGPQPTGLGRLRPTSYQGRSETPPLPDNWIKALLSKTLSNRARPSFPSTIPSRQRSLHKPLSLNHQGAYSRSKKNQNPTTRTKVTIQKVNQYEKADSYVPDEGTR